MYFEGEGNKVPVKMSLEGTDVRSDLELCFPWLLSLAVIMLFMTGS